MARQFAATVQGLLGLLVGVTSLSLPALNGDLRVASTPANRTTLDAIKPPIINHCEWPACLAHRFNLSMIRDTPSPSIDSLAKPPSTTPHPFQIH